MANKYLKATGNWSDDTSVWVTTSGGTTFTTHPVSGDVAYLDAASGSAVLTVDVDSTCASVICTGFTGSLVQNANISTTSTITLVAGMTYTPNTYWWSSGGTATITTGGKHFYNFQFYGAAGYTATLADALNVDLELRINMTTATHVVTLATSDIYVGANIRMMSGSFAARTIIMNGTGYVYSYSSNNVIRSSLTINTSGTIYFGAPSYPNVYFDTGTLTYTAGTVDTTTYNSTLNIAAAATLNCASISFNNVTLGGTTWTLTLTGALDMSGTLTVNATAITIATSNITCGGLNMSAGTIAGTGRTITLDNTGTWSATSSTCYPTCNVTINPASGKTTTILGTVYYRTGTLSYSNSGGGSVVTTDSTLVIGAAATVSTNGMNWNHYSPAAAITVTQGNNFQCTGTMTLAGSYTQAGAYTISGGNLTVSATCTATMTGNWDFSGTILLSAALTQSGVFNLTANYITSNGAFTHTLTGTWTAYIQTTVQTGAAVFNTSTAKPVTTGGLYLNGFNMSGTAPVVFGGNGTWSHSASTVTLANPVTIACTSLTIGATIAKITSAITYSSGTVDASTNSSTLYLTAAITMATNGMNWYNVNLGGTTWTLTLTNAFNMTGTLTVAGTAITIATSDITCGALVNSVGTIAGTGRAITIIGTVAIASSWTTTATAYCTCNVTLNPASGKTVTLNSTIYYRTGVLAYSASGGGTITTTGSTLAPGAACTFNTNGMNWYDFAPTAAITYTFTSNFQATGTLTLAGAFTQAGAFTVSVGNITQNVTSTVTMTGNWTCTGTFNSSAAFTQSGVFTFNIGVLNMAGAFTRTLTGPWICSGQTTIAGGACVLTGMTLSTAGLYLDSACSGTTVITLTGGTWQATNSTCILHNSLTFLNTANITVSGHVYYDTGILSCKATNLLGNQISNASPYTVSASSETSATYAAWKCMNNDTTTTYWQPLSTGGFPSWLKIDFGTTKVVREYSIYPYASYEPINWTVSGSNTGAFAGEETVIDTQTNQPAKANAVKYRTNNTTAFRYYKYNVTSGVNTGYGQILYDFGMYEAPTGVVTTTGSTLHLTAACTLDCSAITWNDVEPVTTISVTLTDSFYASGTLHLVGAYTHPAGSAYFQYFNNVLVDTAICTWTIRHAVFISGTLTPTTALTMAGGAAQVMYIDTLHLTATNTFTLVGPSYITNITSDAAAITTTLAGLTPFCHLTGNLTLGAGSVLTGTTTGNIYYEGTGTWSGAGTLKCPLVINTAGTLTVSNNVYYDTGTITYTAGTMAVSGSTLHITAATTLATSSMSWYNVSLDTGTWSLTLTNDLHLSAALIVNATAITIVTSNIYCSGLTMTAGSITGTGLSINMEGGTWSAGGATGIVKMNLNFVLTANVTVSGNVYYDTGILSCKPPSLVGTQISNASPYVTSADNEVNGAAWQAMDSSTATYWQRAASLGFPAWHKIDFGAGNAKTVTSYTLWPYAAYELIAWKFQGSNNNSDWTDLDTRDYEFQGANKIRYKFSNSTAYRYYRLYVTNGVNTSYGPILYDYGLAESPSGSVTTTGSNLNITAAATMDCSSVVWYDVSPVAAATVTFTDNFYSNGTLHLVGSLTHTGVFATEWNNVLVDTAICTWTARGTVTINGTLTPTTALTMAGAAGKTMFINNLHLTATNTLTMNSKTRITNIDVDPGITATLTGLTPFCTLLGNLTLGTGSTLTGAGTISYEGTGTWSGTGTLKNTITINTTGTFTVSGDVYYDTGVFTYTAGTFVSTGSTLHIPLACTLTTGAATWDNISPSAIVITLGSALNATGQLHLIGATSMNGAFTATFGNVLVDTAICTWTRTATTGVTVITGTLELWTSLTMSGAAPMTIGTVWIRATTTTTFVDADGASITDLTIDPSITATLASSGTYMFNVSHNISIGAGSTVVGDVIAYVGTGALTTGASAVLKSGFTVNTAGTLTLPTTLNYNTGVWTYTAGNVDVSTNSNTLIVTAATTFAASGMYWNNVTLAVGTWSLTLTSAMNIAKNLVVNGTAITLVTSGINVGGDLTMNGGTISGTTITMNGTGTWSAAANSIVKSNLTIDTRGTVTISGNVYYDTGILKCLTQGPNLLGTQTSNSSPYTVVASSEYSATYAAWKCMNNDTTTTFWETNATGGFPCWIKVDLGSGNAKTVTEYNMWIYNGYEPYDWQFLGSNNGSDWVVLDRQVNQGLMPNQANKYYFNNTTAYRHYQLYITNGILTSGYGVIIYDLQLTETLAGSIVTTGSTLNISAAATMDCPYINWNNVVLGGTSYTLTMTQPMDINGTLTVSAATGVTLSTFWGINLSGNLSMTGGYITGCRIIMDGTGSWTANSATAQVRSDLYFQTTGTITVSGNVYYQTGILRYISAGTMNVSAAILNLTAACSLYTDGVTWGTWRPAVATYTLLSAFQATDAYFIGSVTYAAGSTYTTTLYNLYIITAACTFSIKAPVYVTNNLDLSKNLTMAGVFTFDAVNILVHSGVTAMTIVTDCNVNNITLDASVAWAITTGVYAFKVGENVTCGSGAAILTPGRLLFVGTGTFTPSAANITCDITVSGAVTVLADLNYATGVFTYSAGTFDMSGYNLNVMLTSTFNTSGMTWTSVYVYGATVTMTLTSIFRATFIGVQTTSSLTFATSNLEVSSFELTSTAAYCTGMTIVFTGTGTLQCPNSGSSIRSGITFNTAGTVRIGVLYYRTGIITYTAGTILPATKGSSELRLVAAATLTTNGMTWKNVYPAASISVTLGNALQVEKLWLVGSITWAGAYPITIQDVDISTAACTWTNVAAVTITNTLALNKNLSLSGNFAFSIYLLQVLALATFTIVRAMSIEHVYLSANLTMSGAFTLAVTTEMYVSSAATLTLSGATTIQQLSMAANLIQAGAFALTIGDLLFQATSSLTVIAPNDPLAVTGSVSNYPDVTGTISSSVNTGNLSLSAGGGIILTDGKTLKVTGASIFSGTSGSHTTLSSTGASRYVPLTAPQTVSYLDVTDVGNYSPTIKTISGTGLTAVRSPNWDATPSRISPDSYDKVILKCNGTGNTFTDSSTANPKSVSAVGAATQLANKFTRHAGYFSGTTGYIDVASSSDWAPGTGTFCSEVIFMFTPTAAQQHIFDTRTVATNTTGYIVSINATNNLVFGYGGTVLITGATALVANTWYHVMVNGNGGSSGSRTVKMYLNAVQEGSTGTYDYNFTDQTLRIGARYATAAGFFSGWMKELRISNVERTVAVPTVPYTDDSNTKLLLHFNSAAQVPLDPSIYYGGTAADFPSIPNQSEMDFGTNPFTVEGFVKVPTGQSVWSLFQKTSGASGISIWGSIGASNNIRILINANTAPIDISGLGLVVEQWYHVAVERIALNSWAAYLNGYLVSTGSSTVSIGSTTMDPRLGGSSITYSGGAWTGQSYQKQYVRHLRISNVARYNGASFVPPTNGHTVDANTLVYLKGDENNGVKDFIDSTARYTVTSGTDNKIKYNEDSRCCILNDSCSTPKYPYYVGIAKTEFFTPFGDSCLKTTTADADYLSVAYDNDMNLGSNPWTVEFFCRNNVYAESGIMMFHPSGGSTGWGCQSTSNVFHFQVLATSRQSTTTVYPGHQWAYVAFTRISATNWRAFYNGIYEGIYTTDVTPTANVSSPLLVSEGSAQSGGVWVAKASFVGRMDNVRVSNGIARYSIDFNPLQEPPTPIQTMLKISGVPFANINKVAGVNMADAKKIMGVA